MQGAFLIMLLGLINLRFDLLAGDVRRFVKGQVWRIVVGVPLCFAWVYVTLPALVPNVGYTVVLLPLFINALVTLLEVYIAKKRPPRAVGRVATVILVAIMGTTLYLNVLVVPFNATALRDVPVVRVSTEPMPVMDLEHIRLVPFENARWRADKVLGGMGAGFEVGHLNIQMVGGQLYWIAPLEFRGFMRWWSFREAPGFIMVDAEDAGAPAEFVASPLKYTRGAFFGRDLHRHIYGTHSRILLLDASFELDDAKEPWWVMSVGRPTVGKTGTVVTGVVIVHPLTGEMREYELAAVPAWVDRVIPEQIAEQHNDWFGRFIHGYWNSLFGQRDVHLPTAWEGEVDVFGVVGPDRRFYWFTGHTSPGEDQSLMGYTMMDGRTGKIVYYQDAVGLFNEAAAVASVNAAVADFVGWRGAQPLLYNLYGAETYVVPVLSDTNILKAIGLVNARTGHTIVEPTMLRAVMAYRQYLGQGIGGIVPTGIAELQTLEGEVVRIGAATAEGQTVFHLRVAGADRIFTATAALSAEIVVTAVGDRVSLTYLDTAEPVVPLAAFDNLGMP